MRGQSHPNQRKADNQPESKVIQHLADRLFHACRFHLVNPPKNRPHRVRVAGQVCVTACELRATARRVVTAKKLYNQREGWTRAEDTLPRRFLGEGIDLGGGRSAQLTRQRLDAMIQAYYAGRGWGADGRVGAGLIAEVGLEDISARDPLPSSAPPAG